MSRPARRDPTLPIAALVALGIAALGLASLWEPWGPARWTGIERATGWTAAALLAASLAVTPLTSRRRRERWRRGLGVGAAVAALAHGSLALAGPLRDAWPAALTWPSYRAGAVALGILTVLLVTSFPSVVRRFRLRVWKPIHRLAYVAVLLVALHVLRSPFAEVAPAIGYASLAVLLLAWRLVRLARRGAARGPLRADRQRE